MGRRIALLLHHQQQRAVEFGRAAARALVDGGCEVTELVAPDGLPRLEDLPLAHGPDGVDLAISFGGDGTFLHAAHLVRDVDVPLLGINLGRLGFLAEVEPDGLDEAMARVARGEWTTEDRPTLDVVADGPDGSRLVEGWALNEVSVEKTARQRVLVMDIEVAGTHMTQVPADAVVISTPTGSTAYAFSAGGPILSPRVAGTLVTPVAPHSVFDRTIVAAVDEPVRIHVLADQEPAVVSCDGRNPVEVPAGGSVTAVGGATPLRIARLDHVDFYDVVRRKFHLR